MCGTAGIASVMAGTQALAHRGPGGMGFWRLVSDEGLFTPEDLSESADVVLGHRRRDIVDLEGGAEPMPNEDGFMWVVFNRETYNHMDLRCLLCPPTKRFQRKRGSSHPLGDLFTSDSGLLAEHGQSSRPLLELPELSSERVEAAHAWVGATALTRRRSVLYVLAQRLELNRRAAPAAS